MLVSLRGIVSISLWCLAQRVIPDSIADHWTVPDGLESDFGRTFYNGNTLNVRWVGWESRWTEQYMEGLTVADLWVTSFYWQDYHYAQLLSSSHNISQSGTYLWTSQIDDKSLVQANKYVLLFMILEATYDTHAKQISSPGIVVFAQTTTCTVSTFTALTTTTLGLHDRFHCDRQHVYHNI